MRAFAPALLRPLLHALVLSAAACSGSAATDDAAVPPDMATAPPPDLTVPIPTGTTLTTAGGVVNGSAADGVRSFLGIPYAAPPTGDRRFQPPAPAAPWATPRDASRRGPACPQFDLVGGAFVDNDEDCLNLNVWTPMAPATPLPIMVFLHGGGFTSGSGGDPLYDGTHLVQAQGVVVVTLNYRLGPLGFLAHAALSAEDPAHPGSGDVGLLDQRLALAWVQQNIAVFGGDPARVTLFGESAGGISVCAHLASPGSRGVFQRAIVESGVCWVPIPTATEAQAQGDQLAKAVGCTDAATVLACLRGKTPRELFTALPPKPELIAGPGVSWQPSVDGEVLTDQMGALLAKSADPVPLLIGTNGDEGTLFLALGGVMLDEAGYEAQLTAIFGAGEPVVLGKYPASDYASPDDAYAHVLADAIFVCPSRRVARAYAKLPQPTFEYSFTHAFNTVLGPIGAFHSSELPFVFGNDFFGSGLSADEAKLSAAMMRYWTRFAATGDPNGGTDVAWPAYDAAGDQHLVLDLTIAPGAGLRKTQCDFWDAITPP